MDRKALERTLSALCLTLVATALPACSTDENSNEGLQALKEAGINQIAFISRSERLDTGDVFQYTTFSVEHGSANIMKLDAVSGGSEAEAITPFGTDGWAKADIMAMDVSFDGQEIVFSARLEGEATYGIWRIKIDGSNPEEPGEMGPARVYNGPFDAVFPVYLPNERIFFMTNQVVSEGVKQFRDEYERGTTAQAATMNIHGGDIVLGPRNLSHRVAPTLITRADGKGQILHTNWDHINTVNEGNLMVMNPDLTGGAEFYGKEGSGVANSYLKPRQINPNEYIAIATDREDTFQSGALIKIQFPTDGPTSEVNATTQILTPDVPRSKEPSFETVGRYYDGYPIVTEGDTLAFVLTSWADGPVQSEVAGGGMSEDGVNYGEGSGPPDFGIYVLDPDNGKRLPVFNAANMWDVLPMPIGIEREEPISSAAPSNDDAPDGTALIGAINVYQSSLSEVPSSDIHRVRVIEGFSAEEGIPMDFGLTEADGAILLGEARVKSDGSFAAYVPEDRPLHLQLVNGYGIAAVNEDRWFSAAAGEERFCGGCHETRGETIQVDPGLSEAVGEGPELFALPYGDRTMPGAEALDAGQWEGLVAKVIRPEDPDLEDVGRLTGLPWDLGAQAILDDAACGDCHNGVAGPANPSVTITDTMSEDPQGFTWVFDLGGEKVDFEYGMMTGNYTKSHISMLLMAGLMAEEGIELEIDPTQPYQSYIVPESAYESIAIRYMNPTRIYPEPDANDHAFTDVPKWNDTAYAPSHPNTETPGYVEGTHRALRPEEIYFFTIIADLGGQYYSMENAPGNMY